MKTRKNYSQVQSPPTTSDLEKDSSSPSEVMKILKSSRLKPSPVDVLPTALLRSAADTLSPIFAHT